MGLFNTVEIESSCPSCHQTVPLKIQYKFGATRQFSYQVADKIQWGANDVGEPGHHSVVVLGIAESCIRCRHDDDREFYIYIVDDIIDSVNLANGVWDLLHLGGHYIDLGS